MKLGVLILLDTADVDSKFKQVADYGFHSCQLCCWDMSLYTDDVAENIKTAMDKYDVRISTLWAGWSGPKVWDFYDGQLTLGLLPREFRYDRMKELMQGSDFAKKLGVKNVATHVGYMPENPNTLEYREIISAIRSVALHFKENDQYFLFETGQETPVTMLRCFETVGCDNLGINLDTANLILYGKANPVDALDVFGRYVRNLHAKDGCYPTNGHDLGCETRIGDGKVDFRALFKRLHELGYDSYVTIEREIDGAQQLADINHARDHLQNIIDEIYGG